MDGAGAWGRISTPPQMGQSRQHSGATAYFRHDDHGDGDDSIGDGDDENNDDYEGDDKSVCVCVMYTVHGE